MQGEVGEHGQKGGKGAKGEHVSDLHQALDFLLKMIRIETVSMITMLLSVSSYHCCFVVLLIVCVLVCVCW